MRRCLCVLAMLLAGCAPAAPAPAAAPGRDPAAVRVIGFGTVADAHSALAARRDVEHSVRGTYEVFVDPRARAIWLFTLPGSAAYPALVRRQLADAGGGGGVVMTSSVFCEAERTVCSLLQENTRLLDAAIMEQMNRDAPTSSPNSGPTGGPDGEGAAPRHPPSAPPTPTPGVRT